MFTPTFSGEWSARMRLSALNTRWLEIATQESADIRLSRQRASPGRRFLMNGTAKLQAPTVSDAMY